MKNKLILFFMIFSLIFLVSCKNKTKLEEGISLISDVRPEYSEKEAIGKVSGDIIEERGRLKLYSLDNDTEVAMIFSDPKKDTRICNYNCNMIQGGIELYNMDTTDPKLIIKEGKIPERVNEYMVKNQLPQCPSGGEYVYDKDKGVICSVHGNQKYPLEVDNISRITVVAFAWKENIVDPDKLKQTYEKYFNQLYSLLTNDSIVNNLYFLNDKPDYTVDFINTVEEKNYEDDKLKGVLDGKASISSNFRTQQGELVFSCQKEFFRKNDSNKLYFILSYTVNK